MLPFLLSVVPAGLTWLTAAYTGRLVSASAPGPAHRRLLALGGVVGRRAHGACASGLPGH